MLQSRSSSAWVSDPGMRPIVAWGLKPTFANCQHSQGLIELFLLPTSWKNLERAEAGTDWQRMIYPRCNLKNLNGTWWHCKSCTACSILWIIAIQTQLCKELTALILRHETNADFDTLQLCSNDVQIYASDLGQVFTCLICSLGISAAWAAWQDGSGIQTS